ncbi:hypothetical protein KJE01_09355 [Escherichia marmotae]|uniref:Transposase n=1 Tax=Escherichia marmotae TaxID=1499973 RepID=A0A370VBP8_9ESCH|nr:hypothetical protein [Escherichia coli]MBB2415939.1 hypothetical protein [Escherichia sp. 11.1596]MBB2419742.1 hypothetical protein [Escherichia sp. 12.2610]MBB2434183.1 hypothetical protein [Escherichia sp. 11.1600]MBE1770468.1 hypothetical protein [Escherichia marmotae]PSY67237.1 hypothetical protein C7B16_06285 [Escherichia sp. 20412-1]
MTIAERLRQEGHQIGWQEGKIEGLQEGKLEGLQEGKVEGMHEQAIKITLRMLEQGIDRDLAARSHPAKRSRSGSE